MMKHICQSPDLNVKPSACVSWL